MTEYEHRIDSPLVRCFAEPWTEAISLYVHWKQEGKSYRLATRGGAPYPSGERPEFEWVSSTGIECRGPTLELSVEAARQLMNSLWECGIRPVQGKGSAGQLEATRQHLEDMRHIAFGKLELSKP